MDIKEIVKKKIGLYERRIEAIQERLLRGEGIKRIREESPEEQLKKWHYREEELLEILEEIVKEERKEK